jgi:manganese oxidase
MLLKTDLILFLLFLLCVPVIRADSAKTGKRAGHVRHYFLAAENVDWDYAPSGEDLTHNMPIPSPWAGRTKFRKTRYIEYTDATFTIRKPQPEWLGILGPILRAEVGDHLEVTLLNRTQKAHSLHPHGVRYDALNSGADIGLGPRGIVEPGESFTYHWYADRDSGPAPGGPASRVWLYHSHVEEPEEVNAGLIGTLIITAAGKAKADGSPKDVDREFVVLFTIFDESPIPFRGLPTAAATVPMIPDEKNLFHTMNGRIFGNLRELVMRQGEKVRWHLVAMGNERDIHTAHWHGERVTRASLIEDNIPLVPGSMETVDMVADNPGTWFFHCHVEDHMEAGMMMTYTIMRPPRACPVTFESGDFWSDKQQVSVNIRNATKRTIKRVVLGAGAMTQINDLRMSFDPWEAKDLAPSGIAEIRTNINMFHPDAISAWAFFPQTVIFSDGSRWTPNEWGECFHIFWKDKQHPPVTVLPRFQSDMDDD